MPESPVPYRGSLAQRRARLGESYVERSCGWDRTGKRIYAYNTLGFRGAEFHADAPLRVYIFGESTVFGTGLQLEDTWPVKAAGLLRQELGLPADDVCVMNFADNGASNAAIARMIVTQCSAAPPDLALIHFAEWQRTEALTDDAAIHLGPWLLEEEVRAPVRAMPDDDRDKAWCTAAIEQADRFFAFYDPALGRLAALREILLAQFFLASRGVPALAMCRRGDHPGRHGPHPILGPLATQLDPGFLLAVDFGGEAPDRAEDGRHIGPKSHDAITAQVRSHAVASGLVDRIAAAARRRLGASRPPDPASGPLPTAASVKRFYDGLPFNLHRTPGDAAAAIRRHDLAGIYPDLHARLARGRVRTAIEFGCGAGWLAATLALHYGVEVTAIDFCERALERARDVAAALGIEKRVRFVSGDLFEYEHGSPVDLVLSVGALHHTRDCAAAFTRVQRFAGENGAVFAGLYHAPGRGPFLELFRTLLATEGEDAAFARYRELDGIRATDDVLLRSWFRDQVLHPHESQHTLREVCGWLDRTALALRSTSINGFGPVDDREALFALETGFEARSRRANFEERRYFPGFFTVLAERAV